MRKHRLATRTKQGLNTGGVMARLVTWLISLGVTLCLVATSVAGGEIYKWKDDNGVVHYSDQPRDNKAEPITITPPAVDQATAERTEKLIQSQLHPDEKQTDPEHQSVAEEQPSEQEQQACEQARERIRFLTELAPSRRLRTRNEDGTWHWLTPEEVAEQLQKAKETAAKVCR
jgi:hypothetical protein